MAPPVPFKNIAPNNSRDDLKHRIDQAPVEHAEAILSAYDLLQKLHDSGTLDLLRGALGAGDVLVNHAVSLIAAPESMNAIRNLIIFAKLLGSIDPDLVHTVLDGVTAAAGEEPPSLLALTRNAASKDSRRGIAAMIRVMEIVGSSLAQKKAGTPQTSSEK